VPTDTRPPAELGPTIRQMWAAVGRHEWDIVRERALDVLRVDPENEDGRALFIEACRKIGGEGQRKLVPLTVVFCDLVDSTRLA
jgi:hypothetical protein